MAVQKEVVKTMDELEAQVEAHIQAGLRGSHFLDKVIMVVQEVELLGKVAAAVEHLLWVAQDLLLPVEQVVQEQVMLLLLEL